MLILSQTTDKIQVVLAGAVATNQAQCVASWRDITATPTYTAGRSVVNTNGSTDVDAIAAPAASTQRVIDYFGVYNADTASITITVKFDANGTDYILWKGNLATLERLEYENGKGWTVSDANGVMKYVGTTGATGAGVPTGGLTGEVLAKNSNTNYDTAWVAAAAGIADGDKGDLTVSSSGTVWTIDTNVVTNAKSAQMVGRTMKGNSTDSTANASDLTIAQINALLNLDAIRFNLVQ